MEELAVFEAESQVEAEVLVDLDCGGADGVVFEGLGLLGGFGPNKEQVAGVGDFEVFDEEFAGTLEVFLIFTLEPVAEHLFNLSLTF